MAEGSEVADAIKATNQWTLKWRDYSALSR